MLSNNSIQFYSKFARLELNTITNEGRQVTEDISIDQKLSIHFASGNNIVEV
jgi:hypothetical protein